MKTTTLKFATLVTLFIVGTFSCISDPKFIPDVETDTKNDTDTGKM